MKVLILIKKITSEKIALSHEHLITNCDRLTDNLVESCQRAMKFPRRTITMNQEMNECND